jgi:hypothetical protein
VKLEAIEKQLDIIPKIIKVALQLGIGLGALIIVIYSGRVGYYPSGLTVGDSLLFIAVALSFGFSYSIVVLLLFCTAIALTPFWRVVQTIAVYIHKLYLGLKHQTTEAENIKFPPLTSDQLGIAITGIFGVILIIITIFKDFDLFMGLFISVGLMAFCYLLLKSKNIQEDDSEEKLKSKNKIQVIFAFAIYLIPMVVGRFQGSLLDQSMRLIGIRSEAAIVQFHKDYEPFVKFALDTKDKNIFKAKLLFNGLGTNSVLEIEGKRFVVPNNQYRLLYEENANIK